MYKYCGKEWSLADITGIRELLTIEATASRLRLSRLVCEAFDWRRPNGLFKEMSCRVAMLKMERDGLIKLPAPRSQRPRNYQLVPTPQSDPEPELVCELSHFADLKLEVVSGGPALKLWNELVGRHHYLGYTMLPGAQMRYFIRDGHRVLGAMGFGAAAWKVAPRDNFIGWTPQERQRGLPRIVGQSRFLILPWIHCRNLASKVLSMVTQRLVGDWEQRYGFQPVLLETFVDSTRFSGTCYQASHWHPVGYTKGRGKLDRHPAVGVPVKSIWLKPLSPDFRQRLKEPATS